MGLPAVKRATYADLCAVPDRFIAELLNGELLVSPRPAGRHAVVTSEIGAALIGGLRRAHGRKPEWVILHKPELHAGDDVVVPDLTGWRSERLPRPTDHVAFEVMPDWVCEVLSPGTGRRDRTDKLAFYAAADVPWCWLVDPPQETVEVFRLQGDRWLLEKVVGGDSVVSLPPFEEVSLELSWWWGRIPAEPEEDVGGGGS